MNTYNEESFTKEAWKSLINTDWKDILSDEFDKPYFDKLNEFLKGEYKEHEVFPKRDDIFTALNHTSFKDTKILLLGQDPYHNDGQAHGLAFSVLPGEVFPKRDDIFTALNHTSFKDTKILLLGQDPYHNDGQAHGLAFSVLPGIKTPPSLKNMYKELNAEYGCFIPDNGYLMDWADQGVLLLNTALTVRAHEANSHSKKGWEKFTDRIIEILNDREDPIVFILWGNNAKKNVKLINTDKHYVLEGTHPSPLSENRGFFGCDHFKKANEIVKSIRKTEIDWQINK